MKRAIFTVKATPPYDFDLTAAYATYFRRDYGADMFENGIFRRLLDLGDCLCLASVHSSGTMDSPDLEIEVAGAALDSAIMAKAQRQVAWNTGH